MHHTQTMKLLEKKTSVREKKEMERDKLEFREKRGKEKNNGHAAGTFKEPKMFGVLLYIPSCCFVLF